MPDPTIKQWSVLVYMAADANNEDLRQSALLNLSQMKSVGSSDQVWIAAQADLPAEPTRRYVFPERTGAPADDFMNVIELNKNVNSGSPKTLLDFFAWATQTCPARNILFILWGHGYGLDDYDPFAPGAPAALTAPTLREELSHLKTSQEIPLGGETDYPTQSLLLNSQIAAFLNEGVKSLPPGQTLAILGFDCCEMALLEVWFEMKVCVPIALGSQYIIPYTGWPYDVFLKTLLADPAIAPRKLSSAIIDAYIAYSESLRPKPIAALSACDLTATDALITPITLLGQALTTAAQDAAGRAKIFAARNASPIFDQDGFIDLGGFCRQLQVNFSDPGITSACGAVCKALGSYVIQSAFSPVNTTKKISRSTGVSVWFPPWIQYPDLDFFEVQNSETYFYAGYAQTSFAKETGWGMFLDTLLRQTRAVK